ncbi:MAG TPA: DUF4339 domain-containing protein [Candidatus Latescibacteria bacterium]|nr:DUF4339 domain-containing protein [Candidatus Latescibacterota bacterium]
MNVFFYDLLRKAKAWAWAIIGLGGLILLGGIGMSEEETALDRFVATVTDNPLSEDVIGMGVFFIILGAIWKPTCTFIMSSLAQSFTADEKARLGITDTQRSRPTQTSSQYEEFRHETETTQQKEAMVSDMTNTVQDNGSEWYYELNGERKGPVPRNKIQDLLNQGTLSRESKVWQKGMNDWVALAQTDFAVTTDVPPPLTGSAVKNDIVWALAFAPLYGLWIEQAVALGIDEDVSNLWFITLGINIGLSYFDEKRLKKAGHNTEAMGAAWLVPVYLFKRAEVLKQKNSYFIVWCVMFVLMLIASAA